MRWTSAYRTAIVLVALAGPVSAQPAPQPLTLLDVPFLSQSEALCGGAAAAMVLRYWGARGLDAESFAHLVDRSAAGIRTDALVGELRSRGWNATGIKGDDGAVEAELERGRPVLALIEDRPGTFHYIVIVARTARAVVFHDPARAPTRVMGGEEFAARWRRAGRWMAVIVPGERVATPAPPTPPGPEVAAPCDRLVSDGVARAQAGDLVAAEQALTAALSCPGAAAARELAGVRLLQRRWADVETLAAAAVAIESADAHAWRLLGSSRFLQSDALGALSAWNAVAEPRVDLVSVAGLVRTRQRPVEQLMGVREQEVLTPRVFVRARRRLQQLPSAVSTRLEYVPVPSGLAELKATVNERPLLPSDVWSYAALAAVSTAKREIELPIGSLSGGGERITVAWRFWRDRPRVSAAVEAPAPWGGTWRVRAFTERQPFDSDDGAARRAGGDLTVGDWVTPLFHVSARGGVDRWDAAGVQAVFGAAAGFRSAGDRVEAILKADLWAGEARFAGVEAALAARSSADRAGTVLAARAGFGTVTAAAPRDLWLAGDTGDTRTPLLRAHPLVEDGRFRTSELARRLVHASLEARHWWPVSAARVGAAVFADAAHGGQRLTGRSRGDVDVGAGVRLAVPGLAGTLRADVARGLRDGATIVSFVYEASGW